MQAPPGRRPTLPPATRSGVGQTAPPRSCYASQLLCLGGGRGRAPEPTVLLHKTHARQHHAAVLVRQTHARQHRPADVRRHQPPVRGRTNSATSFFLESGTVLAWQPRKPRAAAARPPPMCCSLSSSRPSLVRQRASLLLLCPLPRGVFGLKSRKKSISRPRLLLHSFVFALQLRVDVLLRIVDTPYVTVARTLHHRREAVSQMKLFGRVEK